MTRINKKWVIFSLVFWLLCCQLLFLLVQKSAGEKTIDSIQNQLRQELNFSNFYFLASSISDFTGTGAIKCAVLEKITPDFVAVIDLKYMESSCTSTPILLNGNPVDISLVSLNGDNYRLRFISNNSNLFYIALWGFRLIGIVLVLTVIVAFSRKEQKDLIKFQLELDYANKLNYMALQVSHDIRSPLAALKIAAEEMEHLESKNSKIIQIAIGRISEIANDLLNKKIESNNIELSLERLFPILDSIVVEKQFEFKNQQVSISLDSDPQYQDVLVNVNQIELKRIVSNLINNSIEAIPTDVVGEVLIMQNLSDNETALITIRDNGKGISSDLISKLGEKGFSYAKDNNSKSGFGLGLYHAKDRIEKFGGKFIIESEVGIGTTLKIFLPCIFQEKVLVTQEEFYDCVLLDNDELVSLIWQSRAKKKDIKLLVIRKPAELDSYLSKISKNNTTIYIDSELGDNQIKGEEFAQVLQNDGYQKLILTTGHSSEKFAHLPWLECIGKTCPF